MPNSSSGLRYTEGVGDRYLATYTFPEDGVQREVERIAPSSGVLESFVQALGVTITGPHLSTEVLCRGRGRIIVKLLANTVMSDSCGIQLVFKSGDGTIIGASRLVYAEFAAVTDGAKRLASLVFSNDYCATYAYIQVVALPQSNNVDIFTAAV